MAYEQKPNTGSLFKNHKKSKETQPDYSGSCLVNGQALQIGAWLKTSKKGEKFFSMSFKVPMAKSQQANGYQKPQSPMNSDDWQNGEDAPF